MSNFKPDRATVFNSFIIIYLVYFIDLEGVKIPYTCRFGRTGTSTNKDHNTRKKE